jgi:hypothetical protein
MLEEKKDVVQPAGMRNTPRANELRTLRRITKLENDLTQLRKEFDKAVNR